MTKRQSLLRPRTGFELGVLVVSAVAILAIVVTLAIAALSAPSGPPNFKTAVQPAGSLSEGDAYEVRVTNEGGESTENVVVEVRVGSEVREATMRAVARGDVAEATVVFPRGTSGSPQATIISYAATG